ncbi:hypothetical protein [Aquipuribacter nitratireducens]|uniref:Uncharacterized protein n=1 Tax=Aquipuribacter nitratireducens TaxID=650104 RepID=A0ABW0GS34_9MICO
MTQARALRIAVATAATLTMAAAAGPASAAAPSSEQEVIEFEFESETLPELCGIPGPVIVSGEGTATNRTFEDTGKQGLLAVRTVNVAITFTAGERSITVRDVGADTLLRMPDGSLILSIVGQLPRDYKGVLKLDPDTGEVLKEPTRLDDGSHICRALAG